MPVIRNIMTNPIASITRTEKDETNKFVDQYITSIHSSP